MSLTARQERFVAEYLIDLNATQATIRAGYSEKGAKVQGARLLVNAGVAKAVAAAKAERSERTEITQDYVLTTIRDTIERCRQAEPVRYQNGSPVMIDTPDGEIAPAYKFDAGGVLRGAELLGRHLAMFTDKQVVNHNYVARMPAVSGDTEEWLNQYAPKMTH
jgi:phage terminase small subunit